MNRFWIPIVLGTCLVLAQNANADVVFSDDFESYGVQNPFNGGGVWTITGPGGANSSRTFDPNGGGSGFDEIGWISIVDDSGLQVTFDFSALAGTALEDGSGNLFDTNVYDLTFVHATETSVVTRISTFDLNLASSGTISFLSGGNGDASQSFTGLTAQTGTNTGGTVGLTADRQWTLSFSGTGLTTADTLTLDIGRNTSTSGFYLDR